MNGVLGITSDNLPLSEVNTATSLSAVDCNRLAEKFLRASVSLNTQRAIESDVRQFLALGGEIPVTTDTLVRYLVSQSHRLAVRTLRRHVSSLRRVHLDGGHEDPAAPILIRRLLKGMSKSRSQRIRKVEPITTDVLVQLLDAAKDGVIGRRDRLILIIGFGAGLRRSELANLNFDSLAMHSSGVEVHVERSKSDQCGRGSAIFVAASGSPHCVLNALRNWQEVCPSHSGPLFRRIKKGGKVDAVRLSDRAIANIVKRRISSIGLDPDLFSGHSLRAGLATTAARSGVPLDQIRSHTRHKSIDSLLHYVRPRGLFDSSGRNVRILP